nr:MAG TPA: hypothetical protein [Bacteriophage sp.]
MEHGMTSSLDLQMLPLMLPRKTLLILMMLSGYCKM